MKILHLSEDNIFVNNAFHLFESSFPGANHFLILTHKKKTKKISPDVKMNIIDEKTSLKQPYKDFQKFDIVVLHSLSNLNASWILKQKKEADQKIIWMLHGFEAYTTSKVKNNVLYSQKTQDYLGVSFKVKSGLKSYIRPIVETFMNTQNKTILKAAERVDGLGILYKEEHQNIQQIFKMKFDWIPFTYYPLERIINKEIDFVKGYNILLGNSASESNNHLDVVDYLEKNDLNSRKLITPLSYGHIEYRNFLLNYGKKKLGDNFHPLIEFIPYEDYNKLLSTCSITLMNHYRQQAVGTVLLMLYLGSKVYLNSKNTLYAYLKRIGIKIYDIETELDNFDSLNPLEKDIQIKNRNIISKQINEETVIEILKKHLNLL